MEQQQKQEPEWRNLSQFTKPLFPIEVFPENMRKLLLQYHESSGCPIDYAACVMTSTVTAAVYNRFSIQAKYDRLIPLTLYQFAIGDSGSMKSPPFKLFPYILQSLTNEHNTEVSEENKVIEETISELSKRLTKATDDSERQQIKDSINAAKKQLKPLYPYILTDPTLEALAVDAKKCGECVSVFSSESTVVNVISGTTYNQKGNTPNIDIVLKGYDAEYCSISRVGKEHIQMTSPRICICVGGQKKTLETLTRVGEQVERGFPNRCLFYYPEQKYDHNALLETPINPELMTEWKNLITTLFKAERGTAKPVIVLEDEAIRLHDEYRNKCYKLSETVRYSGEIKGWIGKAADKALRYAAILLLMENPKARRIKADDLQRGITFMSRYALPMALIAYGITGNELTDEQNRYMQKIIQLQKKHGQCTEGQLKDSIRAKDTKTFYAVLAYLKNNDYIRLSEVKTSRKPYKVIEINPYYKG